MKIYTKTGDRGETGLWGGDRVAKDHPRVRAYGDVDELNCCLGAVLAFLPGSPFADRLKAALARVQEELFIVGALLATPRERLAKLQPPFDAGLPTQAPERLEAEIDEMTASLKPMDRFIMPGGTTTGAWLHLARATCRRAERSAVELARAEPLPEGVIVYLNRLSDYLFTAARWINAQSGCPETPWQGLAKR